MRSLTWDSPGFVLVIIALVVILVSAPLYAGRVPMNKWYGIRIQKSYSSDENWNAINEYGGRQLVLWSIPMLVAGVVLMALPVTLATGFAAIVVLVVCVAAPLVQVYLFSQELPEPRPADARPAAGHDAGQ